jgi:UDP-4-amino-4-deoxy-L-arabinose-oxoglutarate aminotransferase
VGTFGQLAMCSFQAIKCLTTGEGGMVLSNDNSILAKIRTMQSLSSMSDIQAALGVSQLEQYDSFLQRRQEIADIYFKKFDKFPNICMPVELRKRSMFFRFMLRIPLSYDMIKTEFEKKGISVRRPIGSLLHRRIGKSPEEFPNAEKCFKETLSIPIYPSLHDDEIEYVTKTAMEIFCQCL